MTNYRATIHEEILTSINLNEILSDDHLPGYDIAIKNISPPEQKDFFAFYKVDQGTRTQQLVFWRFPKSQDLSSSLYIFSRSGINQDPSGEYDCQCLSIPSQEETVVRGLLNQGNVEGLLRRVIDIQERKDIAHLIVKSAA